MMVVWEVFGSSKVMMTETKGNLDQKLPNFNSVMLTVLLFLYLCTLMTPVVSSSLMYLRLTLVR